MTAAQLAAAIQRAELFSDPSVYSDREALHSEKASREERQAKTLLGVAIATLVISAVGCVAAVIALF